MFVIRPRSVHFQVLRRIPLYTIINNIADLGIISPPAILPRTSANQTNQANRHYAATCQHAGVVITHCIASCVGPQETAVNFTNCVVYNVLIHDFGTEKIRFVCDVNR